MAALNEITHYDCEKKGLGMSDLKAVEKDLFMNSDDCGPFLTPSPLIRCFVSNPLSMKLDLAESPTT